MLKCLKNVLRNFTLRSDMFAAPTTLRYNGQTSYETMCGGILSILLVIGFATVFYTSFYDVLTKVIITAQTDFQRDPYNDIIVDDIQFAVGIDGIDFSQTNRYFQIVLVHLTRPLGQTPTRTIVQMEVCNISNWENVGDNFDKLFEVHQMSKMLCPKKGEDISLEGFAGSNIWQTLQIRIEKCINQTGLSWQCYPQAVIDNYISSYELENDFFKVDVFVVDTLFTPLQSEYTSKILQDEIFLSFSNDMGSRGKLKIGDYNITTDQSIWPFSITTQQTGHYITDYSTHTVNLFSSHFVKLQIEKDQSLYVAERAHGKIDEMLSYVGGLFSLLFAVIVFFIGSYSQYKYEVAVAQSTFTLDESGKKFRDKDFGFFTFLKYCIYDWIDSLGCTISWQTMETIHNVRSEACQQMDIRFLIKKMQRFERINQLLLKERNLICCQLTKPPTLESIKKLRKITQYYDKVIMCEQCTDKQSLLVKQIKQDNQDVFSETIDNFGQYIDHEDEILSDFDSDDQKAQKQIVNCYKSLKIDKSELSTEIMANIPKIMKKRLNKLESRNKYKESTTDKNNVYSANNTQIRIHTGLNNQVTKGLQVKDYDQ